MSGKPGRYAYPNDLSTPKPGVDLDMLVAAYVEDCKGFWGVRPSLMHLYVYVRPASELDREALRGVAEFRASLRAKLVEKPFRLPAVVASSGDVEVAAALAGSANSEMREAERRRWVRGK